MKLRPYLIPVIVATAIALGAVFTGKSVAPAKIIHAPASVSPVPAEFVAMARTLPGGMREMVALMRQLVIALAPNSPIGRQAAVEQQRAQERKVCHGTVTKDREIQWPNPSTEYPNGVRLYSNGNTAVRFATAQEAFRMLAKLKQQAGCR